MTGFNCPRPTTAFRVSRETLGLRCPTRTVKQEASPSDCVPSTAFFIFRVTGAAQRVSRSTEKRDSAELESLLMQDGSQRAMGKGRAREMPSVINEVMEHPNAPRPIMPIEAWNSHFFTSGRAIEREAAAVTRAYAPCPDRDKDAVRTKDKTESFSPT